MDCRIKQSDCFIRQSVPFPFHRGNEGEEKVVGDARRFGAGDLPILQRADGEAEEIGGLGLRQVLAPAPRLELGGEGVLVFLRDTLAHTLTACRNGGRRQRVFGNRR